MSQPIESAAYNATHQAENGSGPQQVMTEAEMRAKIDAEIAEINKAAVPAVDHVALAKAQGIFIARQGIFIQDGVVEPYIEAQETFAVEQSHELMKLDKVAYSKLLADFIAMQANLLHNLGAI
jgi:hypothetical protein